MFNDRASNNEVIDVIIKDGGMSDFSKMNPYWWPTVHNMIMEGLLVNQGPSVESNGEYSDDVRMICLPERVFVDPKPDNSIMYNSKAAGSW